MHDSATSEYLQGLALQIKYARREHRLSQEELAERAVVHPNTIGVAERAERDLNILTQTRILAALGCQDIHIQGDTYSIRFGEMFPSSVRMDIMALKDAQIIQSIGQSIRIRRIELGYTLEDVAMLSGLHLNSVWNCEQGLVIPDGSTIFRLYRALKVSRLVAGGWGIHLS